MFVVVSNTSTEDTVRLFRGLWWRMTPSKQDTERPFRGLVAKTSCKQNTIICSKKVVIANNA